MFGKENLKLDPKTLTLCDFYILFRISLFYLTMGVSSDFDVVLGMNWLNKYKVVIGCFNASLNFLMNGVQVNDQNCKEKGK